MILIRCVDPPRAALIHLDQALFLLFVLLSSVLALYDLETIGTIPHFFFQVNSFEILRYF